MRERQLHSVILVPLLLLLLVAAPACADYIPPDQVTLPAKSYTPKQTNFEIGTYRYNVNWQGIPVGRSAITVTPSVMPDGTKTYTVKATAQSASVVALYYSLRHISESVFRADTLVPLIFSSMQMENSKTKSREVRFEDDGQVVGTLYSWKKGVLRQDEQHAFQGTHATFDPITAAFLARSLDVGENEEVSFDVFNGKHRFLIGLRKGAKELVKVGGKMVEAYPVTPIVKKLTDSEGEKRLRRCVIWVSADEKRDVLKLESEVFVGSVRAELVEFTPAPATPVPLDTGTIRASLRAPEAELSVPVE